MNEETVLMQQKCTHGSAGGTMEGISLVPTLLSLAWHLKNWPVSHLMCFCIICYHPCLTLGAGAVGGGLTLYLKPVPLNNKSQLFTSLAYLCKWPIFATLESSSTPPPCPCPKSDRSPSLINSFFSSATSFCATILARCPRTAVA